LSDTYVGTVFACGLVGGVRNTDASACRTAARDCRRTAGKKFDQTVVEASVDGQALD
jgi:hypothetical protein